MRRPAPFTTVIAVLVVAAGGLAAAGSAPSGPPPGELAVSERLHIDTATAGPGQPFEAFDTKKPTLADINGDGRLEIVTQNDNNRLYVFDSRTGRLLAEVETNHPNGWEARELQGVAVGDVDGNGVQDLVVANSVGYVTRFEFNPWESDALTFQFTKKWEKLITPNATYDPTDNDTEYPGLDGHAYLADIHGDGQMEIFVQTDNVATQAALDANGNYLWRRPWGDGNSGPMAEDLDGDGSIEVVYVTDGGRVQVYEPHGGYPKWEFNAREHNVTPGSIPVMPAAVDLDGDGVKELVFGARVAEKGEGDWMNRQHAAWFALKPPLAPQVDKSMRVMWKKQFDWGNPLSYTQPATADVDDDGLPEVIAGDWNTIGRNPGNWQSTDRPANVFALDGDGTLLWRRPVQTWWSNNDFAVADVDGDGAQEVLVPEPRGNNDGISVLSLQGEPEDWISVAPWRTARGPIVADLEGNGQMDIVVPVFMDRQGENYRNLDVGYREGAIKVFATDRNMSAEWGGNFHYSNTGANPWWPDRADVRTADRVDFTPTGDGSQLAFTVDTNVNVESVRARPADGGQWTDLAQGTNGAWVADQKVGHGDAYVLEARWNGGKSFATETTLWTKQGYGVIRGLVMETDTGRPAEGATVAVGDTKTKTDKSGLFMLPVKEGEHTVKADTGDHKAQSTKVTVPTGGYAGANFALEPGSDGSGYLGFIPGPGVWAVLVAAGVGAVALRGRRA